MMNKQNDEYRNPKLLALVRKLPCVCCWQAGRTEAAHSNQARFGKGRGLKASDAAIMALCKRMDRRGCHALLDEGGEYGKLERWDFEYRSIAATLTRLLQLGQLTGEREIIEALPPIETCYEALAVRLIELIEHGKLKVNA